MWARDRNSSTAYTLSLIGGVGGTVTLLSYGYWMREAGWAGSERMSQARGDLTVSFSLVFLFSLAMIFISTQIDQRGKPYRWWAAYLALAAISALVIRRPVWLVFAYTVVGSLFFPFVISTLLWLNTSRHARTARNGLFVNLVLGSALALYAFLAIEAF